VKAAGLQEKEAFPLYLIVGKGPDSLPLSQTSCLEPSGIDRLVGPDRLATEESTLFTTVFSRRGGVVVVLSAPASTRHRIMFPSQAGTTFIDNRLLYIGIRTPLHSRVSVRLFFGGRNSMPKTAPGLPTPGRLFLVAVGFTSDTPGRFFFKRSSACGTESSLEEKPSQNRPPRAGRG